MPLVIRSKGRVTSSKEPIRAKRSDSRKTEDIKCQHIPAEHNNQNDSVAENQKTPLRQHSGIRRTSIKSKERLQLLQTNLIKERSNQAVSDHHHQNQLLRKRWYSNRESLSLPVTHFPVPENPYLPPQAFLQVTGHSVAITGREFWEALESGLERRTGNTFARLLAAMEGQTKSGGSVASIAGGKGTCTNDNCIPSFAHQDKLDNSYHHEHLRHLDALTNVIGPGANTETPRKNKRKLPSKLEIKLAGETPVGDLKIITAGLEEVNVDQEIDNCGNITPVITYNHVSTLNPLEELATASPSGSNKSSRSPSPLLEIPNKSGGKNTKRPPL